MKTIMMILFWSEICWSLSVLEWVKEYISLFSVDCSGYTVLEYFGSKGKMEVDFFSFSVYSLGYVCSGPCWEFLVLERGLHTSLFSADLPGHSVEYEAFP